MRTLIVGFVAGVLFVLVMGMQWIEAWDTRYEAHTYFQVVCLDDGRAQRNLVAGRYAPTDSVSFDYNQMIVKVDTVKFWECTATPSRE